MFINKFFVIYCVKSGTQIKVDATVILHNPFVGFYDIRGRRLRGLFLDRMLHRLSAQQNH